MNSFMSIIVWIILLHTVGCDCCSGRNQLDNPSINSLKIFKMPIDSSDYCCTFYFMSVSKWCFFFAGIKKNYWIASKFCIPACWRSSCIYMRFIPMNILLSVVDIVYFIPWSLTSKNDHRIKMRVLVTLTKSFSIKRPTSPLFPSCISLSIFIYIYIYLKCRNGKKKFYIGFNEIGWQQQQQND